MGKPTGFMEYQRQNGPSVPPLERIKTFDEFHTTLTLQQQQQQGARCMDCGVPFCQAGMMIGGMASGCPLHNLVPEINDLVYHGNWEQAYIRLSRTHCLPEFTSRVCPALCEAACTCGEYSEPVTTKDNERQVIDRRIALMEQAGVEFRCNVDVGRTVSAQELLEEYDRVILACGASQPRDLPVPGREAKGVLFAVDFLGQVTKALLDSDFREKPTHLAEGKQVLVIGGGDTGNDCVGTAIRLGAAGVTQLEMMPKPSETRTPGNPWPQWPRVLKTDYGQQEAIAVFGADPRRYQTTVKEFKADAEGKVCGAVLVSLEPRKDEATGRMQMVPVEGSEVEVAADLVLIAAGFLGSQEYVAQAFGVDRDGRTNVATQPGEYQTSVDRVFTAGDMHRGQSLVVWAIAEGRDAARAVDDSLMGYSNL